MDRDDKIAARVAQRFAFKYEPREKKQTKVDRIKKVIREKTGVSNGVAEDIADAVVRGREVERLAMQKGWPMEGSDLKGPSGSMSLSDIRNLVNTKAAFGSNVYEESRDHLFDMADDLKKVVREMGALDKIVRETAREFTQAANKVVVDDEIVGPPMQAIGKGLIEAGEALKTLHSQFDELQVQVEGLKKRFPRH